MPDNKLLTDIKILKYNCPRCKKGNFELWGEEKPDSRYDETGQKISKVIKYANKMICGNCGLVKQILPYSFQQIGGQEEDIVL